ncbi:MAG: VOC family protein, partial [Paracoccaceae bacterium]|nr:VOC family protein [Paracoccaceae bacterium]
KLDHLVVAGQNLKQTVMHSESALGVSLPSGGQHDYFGTHNRLIGFERREYFEAIAINPNAAEPGRPRWFGLDEFHGQPKLLTWVCRVDDLQAASRCLPAPVDIVELSRGDLRWRMAVPIDGALTLGGVVPLLIEWQGDLHPCDQLGNGGGCLKSLELATPDADVVSILLENLDLNDDRVRVKHASAACLRATIEARHGERILT